MDQFFTWFGSFWEQLISVQGKPEPWMLFVAWGISIGLVFSPLWKVTRNAVTVVHEGGHALTAILWGRRISGIKLHSDTSGVTISSGKPWGLGVIFTTAAGYTAPAFLGLGMQFLASEGRALLGITILGLMLVGIFLSIRNIWGWLVVTPLLVAFYFAFQFAPELQIFLLLFIATFLTVASLKPIIELQMHRRAGEGEGSDADQLAKLTFVIPGLVWVAYFFVISLAANGLAIWLQIQGLVTLETPLL